MHNIIQESNTKHLLSNHSMRSRSSLHMFRRATHVLHQHCHGQAVVVHMCYTSAVTGRRWWYTCVTPALSRADGGGTHVLHQLCHRQTVVVHMCYTSSVTGRRWWYTCVTPALSRADGGGTHVLHQRCHGQAVVVHMCYTSAVTGRRW